MDDSPNSLAIFLVHFGFSKPLNRSFAQTTSMLVCYFITKCTEISAVLLSAVDNLNENVSQLSQPCLVSIIPQVYTHLLNDTIDTILHLTKLNNKILGACAIRELKRSYKKTFTSSSQVLIRALAHDMVVYQPILIVGQIKFCQMYLRDFHSLLL